MTSAASRRRSRRECALCGADVAIKNNGALFLHGCQARQRDQRRNALRQQSEGEVSRGHGQEGSY